MQPTRVMETAARAQHPEQTGFKILGAISFSHFLNDMIQSLVIAIYPLLKGEFDLTFAQIGLITFTYQICASVLQPLVGLYTDRHPQPHSLSAGMGLTLVGVVTLAFAPSYGCVLLAAAFVGAGSSIFHPESSRIARLASGGRHGLAQSIFQVGGNAGSAAGPLLVALVVIQRGQSSLAWFALAPLVAIGVLWNVGSWYKLRHLGAAPPAGLRVSPAPARPSRAVLGALGLLLVLVFSKYVYLISISNYYVFYLISKFHLSVRSAQLCLFVFLFAVAAGTILGGPLGDRIGRKRVIWISILGVAPFTLVMPYVDLRWTLALSFIIGFVLASAFSAIVVYAQELVPGKVGAVSGLFFGFAFGVAGISAAVLGGVADRYGIEFVYRVCAFMPLLGIITVFLPNVGHGSRPPGRP